MSVYYMIFDVHEPPTSPMVADGWSEFAPNVGDLIRSGEFEYEVKQRCMVHEPAQEPGDLTIKGIALRCIRRVIR